MQAIIEEILDNLEEVLNHIAAILPKGYPNDIVETIFNGIRQAKGRCHF